MIIAMPDDHQQFLAHDLEAHGYEWALREVKGVIFFQVFHHSLPKATLETMLEMGFGFPFLWYDMLSFPVPATWRIELDAT